MPVGMLYSGSGNLKNTDELGDKLMLKGILHLGTTNLKKYNNPGEKMMLIYLDNKNHKKTVK